MLRRVLLVLVVCCAVLSARQAACARDAAFMEPGSASGKGSNSDALIADPKNFEAGESTVGIMRRVSLFFVNTGGAPLTITDLTATGDGNVKVETENSDCNTATKIAGFSRCTVALAITPTSPGAWTVEILVKHDGLGRIARALVSGRSVNDAKTAQRAEGLNLSSRDMKPMDFGDVDVAGAPAVRTALMVNDSPETITIKAIDLIAVDSGLERLTTGCEVDQELKPDASCPITLKWQPHEKGNIATDLIMRHTGKIGFTVIPVRGHGLGDSLPPVTTAIGAAPATPSGKQQAKAPPPMVEDLEAITGKLPAAVTDEPAEHHGTVKSAGENKIYLIGMVGPRAILQRSGITKTVLVGSEVELGGLNVKLLALANRQARLLVNGQHKAVDLGASDYRPAASSSSSPSPLGNIGKSEIGVFAPMSGNASISSNSQSSSGK